MATQQNLKPTPYWQKRNLVERTRNLKRTVEQTEWELRYEYLRVQAKIKDKLENLYQKIQSEPNPSANTLYQYRKYYEEYNKVSTEIMKSGYQQQKILERKFDKLYKDNYKSLASGFGGATEPNPDVVKKIIDDVWCSDGKNWKTRVSENQALLAQKIRENLINCIATGATVGEFTKQLEVVLGGSVYRSYRIARTELIHVYNGSALEKYKEAGVEMWEWLTADDERTCAECSAMDGKRFPINNTDQIPPDASHPNCRCTVLAVLN